MNRVATIKVRNNVLWIIRAWFVMRTHRLVRRHRWLAKCLGIFVATFASRTPVVNTYKIVQRVKERSINRNTGLDKWAQYWVMLITRVIVRALKKQSYGATHTQCCWWQPLWENHIGCSSMTFSGSLQTTESITGRNVQPVLPLTLTPLPCPLVGKWVIIVVRACPMRIRNFKLTAELNNVVFWIRFRLQFPSYRKTSIRCLGFGSIAK